MADTIKRIDDLIRCARGDEARAAIREALRVEIPRSEKAPLAQCCWRAGLAEEGIRLLNPVVRSSPTKPVHPTPEEKAEYAACLIKLGAILEAERLLDEIEDDEIPETLLYRAFALMPRWEYAKAIALLEKYSSSDEINEYQKHVSEVNLAQAYIIEHEYQKAEALLQTIHGLNRDENMRLLIGKSYELSAQSAILTRHFDLANEFLMAAGGYLVGLGTIDEFFLKKWRAISKIQAQPDDLIARRELQSVREQASKKNHWETVRECDRFLAIATNNQETFNYLYFGTACSAYREWLLKDFGKTKLPNEFEWKLGPGSDAKTNLYENKYELKPGQLLHQFVTLLSSDFYRPFSIANFFQHLYPNDFYHPVHSPDKIHDALGRLRKWFQKHKIALEISVFQNTYRLKATGPITLIIPSSLEHSYLDSFISNLEKHFGDEPFSPKQASEAMALSLRTAQRYLKESIESKKLSRQGAGRSTRYQITRQNIEKTAS